jgi:hypothetical protein
VSHSFTTRVSGVVQTRGRALRFAGVQGEETQAKEPRKGEIRGDFESGIRLVVRPPQ